MGKQGAELKWWAHSSSSTVLLDPAAFVESWKQQIQGKDGIPAEHQRLIFACRVANQEELSYTCKRNIRCPRAEEHATSEFLRELRTWKAILKDDNHAIAKLLRPLVAAEDEEIASRLYCQTARELRNMGIPCNVYYLFFDKWTATSLENGKGCKSTGNVNIQIDKDFHARSFQILLFGQLNGSNLPLPFIYRMSGGEVTAQMSMQDQMAQYRQGHRVRHRQRLSTQPVDKGVKGGDLRGVMEHDRSSSGCYRSEQHDDYYCRCGKDLELTLIISNDPRQLKCFVLPVIQVPANGPIKNAPKKSEQLTSHVPGMCDMGNSGSPHDSSVFCVSSSPSRNYENSLRAISECLPTTSPHLVAPTISAPLKSSENLVSGASEVPAPCKINGLQTTTDNAASLDVSCVLAEDGAGCSSPLEDAMVKLGKKKKKRKGKRNGRLTKELTNTVSSVSTDSLQAEPAANWSLDRTTWPVMVKHGCDILEATDDSSKIVYDKLTLDVEDSPVSTKDVRQPSTGGERGPGVIVNHYPQCLLNGMDDGSMALDEAAKCRCNMLPRQYSDLAEISNVNLDPKARGLRKCCLMGSFCTNVDMRHVDDALPVSRDLTSSASTSTGCCDVSTEFRDPHALSASPDHSYLSTSTSRDPHVLSASPDQRYLSTSTSRSQDLGVSSHLVSPIFVDRVLRGSTFPARSSGDKGSHLPSLDPIWNRDTCNDALEQFNFSDSNVSAHGGYNSSGAGSRNGRNGADGGGNRNYGRGSDDRKGASGYQGGGQGSSGSNNGGGPGGSSGGSGGSGGGNGNRGGGRGSSGGSWDGRHVDDDAGNGSKEGDNDERHRNSFQGGSKAEGAAESLPRKKVISSLEHRTNHGKKGVSGGLIGDQLMNGSCGSHSSLAATAGSGKETSSIWQKVQQKPSDEEYGADPDELREGSDPRNPCGMGTDEGTPRNRVDFKFHPSTAQMNGDQLYESRHIKQNIVVETTENIDHHPCGQGTTPQQDSFVKVLRQNINDWSHDRDHDHVSSSSSHGGKDSQMVENVPAQDSLKGAWQKKISWDDHRQTAYNRQMAEVTSHAGVSRAKLYVRPLKNGALVRGQLPHTEVISHTRSLSAPSASNSLQENFFDSRELSDNQSAGQLDGCMYQSPVTLSSEQVPEARLDLFNASTARQLLGEGRLPSEEGSQRLTSWKSRKVSSEQEKPLVRDKVVVDRERTTHWAQKWVPVEHKNGGLVKGLGFQSKSLGNTSVGSPAGSSNMRSNGSHQEAVDSTDIVSEEIRVDEVVCISPTKPLRRLQTFLSVNSHPMSRAASSSSEPLDAEEFGATLSCDRLCPHVEQANLRGLLPRERTIDSPATRDESDSTVPQCSVCKSSEIAESPSNISLVDKQCKDSAVDVRRVWSTAEEETRRMARAVLDAVRISCRDRQVAEGVVQEVGCPMAEFEKVLGAVAPSFLPAEGPLSTVVQNDKDNACVSGRAGDIMSREHFCCSPSDGDLSTCRCTVAETPLSSIWQWYEEPSYYGIEVRARDSYRVRKNGGEEEPFLAYFVPYLSALQIFGYSVEGDRRGLGGCLGSKGRSDLSGSQSKVFSGKDVLATLFPTPGKGDEASHQGPICAAPWTGDNVGIHLLYEFYEVDLPQVRQPFFPKVKELLEGVAPLDTHCSGDAAVLDLLSLGDIHPASWFAVAWYPIYRISEGPLRAVFLTYHSFSHFAPRSSLSCLMGGATDKDDSISLPVVGLECYNIQAEPWLSMGGHFATEASKVIERLSVNPSQCLENRISSLKGVAAVMAKGIPDDKASSSPDDSSRSKKFRHSDYDFFSKRRR